MRLTQLLIALFLAAFVYAGPAIAANAAQPTSAAESGKLEAISGIPATSGKIDDKCPMHKGKKDCKEKHGEPCPYHGKEHHDKSHEKCEHEHHNQQ